MEWKEESYEEKHVASKTRKNILKNISSSITVYIHTILTYLHLKVKSAILEKDFDI